MVGRRRLLGRLSANRCFAVFLRADWQVPLAGRHQVALGKQQLLRLRPSGRVGRWKINVPAALDHHVGELRELLYNDHKAGEEQRGMITHNELYDDLNSHAVRVRVHDASGTILLERPEKRNAISRQMLTQLRQAFEDLHQEKKVRAVILTGAGGSFSSGADLVEIHEAMREGDAQTQWLADCVAQQELVEQMLRFPKPIIAAVNGPALGLGATLVLAADLAVGTEGATFGFPETQRGLVSGLAAPLLAFRCGAAAAAHFLLCGESVGCDDCRRLGIYRWVVGEELVWAKADAIARDLTSTAAEAVAMSKRLLNETIGEQVLTFLSAGAAATAAARTMEAAAEGIAAFLEKRPPQWP